MALPAPHRVKFTDPFFTFDFRSSAISMRQHGRQDGIGNGPVPTFETALDSFCAASEHPRRMLFNLLRWLDASPTHYWSVAWSAFALVAALSLFAFAFDRERAWWQKSSFVQ